MQATPPDCRAHRVEFYESEESLADSVARFLAPSLPEGAAVIVGTPDHCEAFVGALAAAGVDPDAVEQAGRLILLDANSTLELFMVEGEAQVAAFEQVIGGILDEAARAGGPVRVYGEMVSVLWQQGQVAAAMRVEELWNDLAADRSFELLCGYPLALFAQQDAVEDLEAVCAQHTSVTLAASDEPPTLPFGKLSGRTAERAVRWQLPCDRTSGARARRHLRDLLGTWHLLDLLDEAELLTTELVNNAVLHAGSEVGVCITHRAGALRVEVSDAGPGTPRPSGGALSDTRGRGLLLVAAMSGVWGTAGDGGAKSVWFELATAS